ncbi:unnamed protein product, partial [Brenthis ino]
MSLKGSRIEWIENDYHKEGINIMGTCQNMCPLQEVNLRKREKLVHVLELTDSGYKMVKSYSRSAASANMSVPQLLRPYSILMNTVNYLLLEVSRREDVKMSVMYDFLNDRLRAVRQDMTIQSLPPEECTVLLEPMIRFYVYYGYRLCDHPLNQYDPVLNKKYLLECLKWFLSCSDTLDRKVDVDAIADDFISLNISNTEKLLCDRILIESLYIICNLDDVHPLYRYLSLPKNIKRNYSLAVAYNIAVANLNGNYIRMWKLSKRLCPLTFSAFCLYLPLIQRRAIQVLSHAYNSKQWAVPVKVVQKWLAFNSEDELRSVCAYYGLTATDTVLFNKSKFKSDVETLQPAKNFQAKVLQLKLQDVLTYRI